MLDLYKYSKKNWLYNFLLSKILRIDLKILSGEFFYKENINLKFKESFFYNYRKINNTTKWSGRYNDEVPYQSNHDLQKFKELNEPIAMLEKLLNDKVKKIIFKKNCIGKFKIKNLWFTIQKKNLGHSQLMHNHPKSTLSGVSYFKVEKNSGGELNLYFQNKKKEFIPENNDVIIFNSNVFHSVNSYYGNSDRIAIAWDAMYTF